MQCDIVLGRGEGPSLQGVRALYWASIIAFRAPSGHFSNLLCFGTFYGCAFLIDSKKSTIKNIVVEVAS
jgi:hypothetical protein